MILFQDCTAFMNAAGIHQWFSGYPKKGQVEKDLEKGDVFIIREKQSIVATITLNDQQDDQYQAVSWQYPSDAVLVIHRLAVSPACQNRGLAQLLCRFAEDFGRSNHFDLIRLDAYRGNPGANYLYQKLGYQLANGQCWFNGCSLPFNCYEKQL